jgi:hypothetical protein
MPNPVIEFKKIFQEELAKVTFPQDRPRVVVQKKQIEHFCERFIQRVGNNEEKFRSILRTLFGTLAVRSDYYVNLVKKGPAEQTILCKGYKVALFIRRGEPCVGDETGGSALTVISTIMP